MNLIPSFGKHPNQVWTAAVHDDRRSNNERIACETPGLCLRHREELGDRLFQEPLRGGTECFRIVCCPARLERTQAGVQVVEPRIGKLQRMDRQLGKLREQMMGLELRTKAVSGEQEIPAKERIPFPFKEGGFGKTCPPVITLSKR